MLNFYRVRSGQRLCRYICQFIAVGAMPLVLNNSLAIEDSGAPEETYEAGITDGEMLSHSGEAEIVQRLQGALGEMFEERKAADLFLAPGELVAPTKRARMEHFRHLKGATTPAEQFRAPKENDSESKQPSSNDPFSRSVGDSAPRMTRKGDGHAPTSSISGAGARVEEAQQDEVARAWDRIYCDAVASVVYLAGPSGRLATGFIVKSGGWIVTNEHVVRSNPNEEAIEKIGVIRCQLDGFGYVRPVTDKRALARVVGTDIYKDLALLKISEVDVNVVDEEFLTISALPLCAETVELHRTQQVMLIGNSIDGFLWAAKSGAIEQVAPYGERASIISAMDEILLSYEGGTELAPEERARITKKIVPLADTLVIQATCPTGQGDSGGPLLDADGNVVGICTRSYKSKVDQSDRSFFVHFSEIRAFIESQMQI